MAVMTPPGQVGNVTKRTSRPPKPIASRVDGRGRTSIPAKAREALQIEPGDTVFFLVNKDGSIELRRSDPVLFALANAPVVEDDDVADEDWQAIAIARAEIARGEGIRHEELPD